jgi:hypothetical protein
MSSISRRTLGIFAAACLTRPSFRGASAAETGGAKPILTVSGSIAAPGTRTFDMAALEQLGLESFETSTPWHNGVVRFEGVPMSRLMETVGADGETVTAVALNDYTTEVPVSDSGRFGVILATKRDGAYMPIRDKGPLFIVYPYDRAPELKSQRYYSRSAWQVTKLIVS